MISGGLPSKCYNRKHSRARDNSEPFGGTMQWGRAEPQAAGYMVVLASWPGHFGYPYVANGTDVCFQASSAGSAAAGRE